MKKFVIQFVLLLIVIGVALYFANPNSQRETPSVPFLPQPPQYSELTINGHKIKVEIADTKEKRGKGLGGREMLASDEGMLFIFDKEEIHSFWMKGLTFPLDFVWIKGDQVADILKNIPPPQPEQKDDTLPIYRPSVPVDKVLEVNAGTADRLNIKVGDTIQLVQ
ncbi:DUF192 domain-containing protein [Candidatus Daviesbacteria bacterium]|nr:DUF192 domain-containing protein [Candidatus Daviesbacteria bacterium]